MPQPLEPSVTKASLPRFGASFDPWNSSSTGHQRPENRPGTEWRESRNKKLNSQFRAGSSGGKRLSDTCGSGSDGWGEQKEKHVWCPEERSARKAGKPSVMDMLARPGTMQRGMGAALAPGPTGEVAKMERRRGEEEVASEREGSRGIFDGVVAYVNGTSHPLVSDHKLKRLLSENGGQMSLHLARRKVTHVILGQPAAGPGRGAGGGLSGGKMEREIKRSGGCGVKYVGAEW